MKPTEQYFLNKTTEIKKTINAYISSGKSIFSTSSFQSQSLPLLHILSEIQGFKKVIMTNTGYLFPETLEFAHEFCKIYDLNLTLLESPIPKTNQVNSFGNFLYTSDPNYCCHINKVLPLEQSLKEHDIWINGIRRDQSSERAALDRFAKAKFGCVRYHPMLDWTTKDIYYYRKIFELPEHPLEKEEYQSVGCQPCTVKHLSGNERNSRWFGLNKTECGINTDLIYKG
jgi:phosphoadenosine phosphosulfate reductase